MKKQRKEKTIPEGFLTKDFLKTLHGQEDVDQFLNDLHARLYEQLLQAEIEIQRDRNGDFEPVIVPKHDRRGMSLEKLVISLYAKGMSVSDIEDEVSNT